MTKPAALEVHMIPEPAKDLQRAYRTKRRRWAYAIGRPYSQDVGKPDPGALATEDPEEG